MKLYLLRHAEAHPGIPDESRALTDRGRQSIKALAIHLKRQKPLNIREIRHSSLLRAQQTASQLIKETGWNLPLREVPLLKPEDEVQTLAAILNEESAHVMLVGHNPHFERLVSCLLTGSPELQPVQFRKSTLVCLTRKRTADQPVWKLAWALSPRVV